MSVLLVILVVAALNLQVYVCMYETDRETDMDTETETDGKHGKGVYWISC